MESLGMLEDLLKTWDGQAQLLFLGIWIDRGEDSRRVLEMVKRLGRHLRGYLSIQEIPQYMFLTWLDPILKKAMTTIVAMVEITTINSIWSSLDAPVDSVEST